MLRYGPIYKCMLCLGLADEFASVPAPSAVQALSYTQRLVSYHLCVLMCGRLRHKKGRDRV